MNETETAAARAAGKRAWAPRRAMDRALWAAPVVSPSTRPHVGMVLHCKGTPPELDQVIAHVAARLPLLPALRSFPAGSSWRIEADLDLTAHVREHRLAPGPASLEAAAGELIGAPLPEQGPAWQLHLLHGHTEDGFALLYRVHHSLQDGGGVFHTLETLFADDTGVPSSAYPGFAPRPRVSLRDTTTAAAALLGGARRAGIWASHPAGFSDERTRRWCEMPVDLLRRAASAHGTTVNDVYLAALAQALTEGAQQLPSAPVPDAVPFLVPVNLRRAGEEGAPGNRVILTSIAVTGGQCTAEERLALTPSATAVLQSASLREAMRRITALIPVVAMTEMLKVVTRPARAAALASNLVLRRRLGFQGAPVTRITPVMWAPLGVPVATVLLTYRDTASVCFTLDPAMPGLDDLPDRWQATIASWI
ncbi:wax ester/triacylglycerol synthase domain-containing protein [Glycomyces algeriensis]|uniref:diacylglycerol O-acyltransferase n=1 Tax=Glycomyces algeriensis TaxID=256037 RepID=A0A9W6G9U0_9ACTN|nr:wax ester/triacylglycerol synthase domain-containing protein [Glycomyces algeriensis]MDA1368981.1 hypothetical protein [Glycomyces algeriensis]MDR7350176.1 hypothetical protein [Glycomyces algeriensis]GLI42888.1 condensation protein [Glycomyces algeriensis]